MLEEVMPLIDGNTRIKVYKDYMKEQPDGLEPECNFSYLQRMLKAQRDSCMIWHKAVLEAKEKEWREREPQALCYYCKVQLVPVISANKTRPVYVCPVCQQRYVVTPGMTTAN